MAAIQARGGRPPVFDGHNDVLLRLHRKIGGDPVRDFVEGDGLGHLDLPRALQGGLGGGLFSVFVPNAGAEPSSDDEPKPALAGEVPLPQALSAALAMVALLARIERHSEGRLKVCRSAREIRSCLASGAIAAVLHIEGAETIDREFRVLDVLHAAGLRSLGPVWSRPNIYGHGVPFRFPASPDLGPGLTEAGKQLVKACEARRIAIDLSHITERGFWDIANMTSAPLIASHSNAHAICASSRNLTDTQLKAIGQSGGVAGLNYANGFLRPDGLWKADIDFDIMLRHLDHMMMVAGEDSVGLGSDFDGARIPSALGSAAGLPAFQEAMSAHGYPDRLIARICHENWLSVLERVWGD